MTNQTMVPGTSLCAADQRNVLASFQHRFTGQNTPAWYRGEWKPGVPYPLQFRDDADWLANTRFAIRRDGRLDGRVRHCESTPTWPLNPELRKA